MGNRRRLRKVLLDGREDCRADRAGRLVCREGPDGLPDLEFGVGGKRLRVPSDTYILPNNQVAIDVSFRQGNACCIAVQC